jgi:hypothetical protein
MNKRIYSLYLAGLCMTTLVAVPAIFLKIAGAEKTIFWGFFFIGFVVALFRKSETMQMFATTFFALAMGVATALAVKGNINPAMMFGVIGVTVFLGVLPRRLVHLSRTNIRKEKGHDLMFAPDRPFTVPEVFGYTFVQFAFVALATTPGVATFVIVACVGFLLLVFWGERKLAHTRPPIKNEKKVSSCPACAGRGTVHSHAA